MKPRSSHRSTRGRSPGTPSRTGTPSRKWLASALAFVVLAAPGVLVAQQAPSPQPGSTEAEAKTSARANPTTLDYTRGPGFPHFFAPYMSRWIPEQSMSNSERIHTLIREGKLYLSLNDALALALENNLDIALARYTPAYAETDILRTRSGGATRANTGAWQSSALFGGALGAGVGGGGTGGGGGGGGASGRSGAINVGSVGSFDPIAGFNFGWDRNTSPLGITILQGGIPFVTTQSTGYSGFLGQRFLTGTSYVVSLGGDRATTTSPTNLFNPQVPLGMTFGLNQPLLKGFGYRANAQFIRLAKNDLKFADSAFRLQVITTVTQVENLYWDLVSFRENVRVTQQALNYAEKLLSDNKRQVEIGTLAPIEVVRAESEVAARQQDLIVAQTSFQQQEELLKTAIAKHVDADLAASTIDATDKLPEPASNDVPPLPQALQLALKNRPELEQAQINLRNQDVAIQTARNALLPEFDLFATYAPQGLSGNALCGTSFHPPCPEGVTGFVPGGVGQALTQVFHGSFPDYSFGVSLQIPLRNRSAQADAARALLEERWLRTQQQQKTNQVEQDVRNAEIAVVQAKAQVNAADKATTLAKQTLDAEQKKFQLGESTVFLVIQAQRDLATAEGNEVKAHSTYAKALTQYAQATGTTLDQNHIEIADARKGEVTHPPNIPGSREEPKPGQDSPTTQ
jgi:outer membrane protein